MKKGDRGGRSDIIRQRSGRVRICVWMRGVEVRRDGGEEGRCGGAARRDSMEQIRAKPDRTRQDGAKQEGEERASERERRPAARSRVSNRLVGLRGVEERVSERETALGFVGWGEQTAYQIEGRSNGCVGCGASMDFQPDRERGLEARRGGGGQTRRRAGGGDAPTEARCRSGEGIRGGA